MGARGAVEIIFRDLLNDKKALAKQTRAYEQRFLNPFVAAERGYIDDVIAPHDTRARLVRGLALLERERLANPWKKHDNIPL